MRGHFSTGSKRSATSTENREDRISLGQGRVREITGAGERACGPQPGGDHGGRRHPVGARRKGGS